MQLIFENLSQNACLNNAASRVGDGRVFRGIHAPASLKRDHCTPNGWHTFPGFPGHSCPGLIEAPHVDMEPQRRRSRFSGAFMPRPH